ncbi:tartrate transporter [Fusarium globosum]|uniref:Tartrate transporter n=2 Tax=Fusarium fujikuroi species complex TaxID=171627 RepID=A0A8H6DL09_9HYPO|nr:tartrate transporter [Fusarium globosum]
MAARNDFDSNPEVAGDEKNSDSRQESTTAVDPALEKKLVRKQDVRIIPLAAGIYLLCYLDRSNIGNAKVLNHTTGHDLLTETNMTNYDFTIALMVFLIAYALFEVPSNYFLKKMKPSRWIAFLMFAWGTITICLGAAHSYAVVTVLRFLLGVFEAGLFPGLVYYLTFWYKPEERSVRVATILASATLAGAFGGAIAYGVGHMNQVHGLSGWRWLFILEGIPSVISSAFVWFGLPDFPESASWLSAEEKDIAAYRLSEQGSHGDSKSMTWEDAKSTLLEWRLWCHYLIYFGISAPFSSLSLFTPSITAGLGFADLRAQLMTVPPYAAAYVVTLLVSWSADRHNARALHSAVFSLVGAVGFIASATLPADSYSPRYGCLIVAACGSFACIPPLLGWLSSNLHSTAAIGLAIALNISMGAPGQIVGVWIYKANEAKKGYPTGHWVNAGLLLFTMATLRNPGSQGYVPLADASPESTEDHVVFEPVKTWKGYIWDTWELPQDQRRLLFKVDAFILTFASIGYFLKNIDQTNINNAFLSGMEEDLEMFGNQLVTSFFESGFYPGIHYMLGSWYTPREIGKRAMLFWLAGSVGSMFSGFLQGAAYTNLNGVHGRAGWRWLFIIDGLITIPLAIAGYFFFPNLPQDGKRTWWTTEEEHILSVKRMQAIGRAGKQPWTKDRVKKVLSSWHTYHLPLLYILWNNGNPQAAMGYWLKSFNDKPAPVPGTSFTVPEINNRLKKIIFNILLLNMPLYSNVDGRKVVYWLSKIGHGAGPLILSWINEICSADTEKRALIVAIANDLAYVVQAVVPVFMWKTTDFPAARKGYTYSTILQVLLILETAFIQLLLWRDRRKPVRSRGAESPPPLIYSDEEEGEDGNKPGEPHFSHTT